MAVISPGVRFRNPGGVEGYGAWRCQLQWEWLRPSIGMRVVGLDPSLLMTAISSRDSPVQPNR